MLPETTRLQFILLTPEIIKEQFTSLSKEAFFAAFGCDDKGYVRYQEMVNKGMESHRISLRFFLIKRREDQQTIGECGFHSWNPLHRRAELFFIIHQVENRGQGYISEALPVILHYGFNDMKLHRIEALIADDNTPSKKLLLKNHFRFEGIMREDYVENDVNCDSHCYSLLQSEFTNLT